MALSDQIQAAIERYCNTKFSATTTTARFNGSYNELIVKDAPIISITTIKDMSVTAAGSTVSASVYGFYSVSGMVYKEDGGDWSSGNRRWEIVYVAGYASIPADIQLAIDMWVNLISTTGNGQIASYSTGDDSESYMAYKDIPEPIKQLLAPYRRIRYWH